MGLVFTYFWLSLSISLLIIVTETIRMPSVGMHEAIHGSVEPEKAREEPLDQGPDSCQAKEL